MRHHRTPEEIVAQIKDWGITLHSEYTHGRAKMKMTCPKGHDFEADWQYLRTCKGKDRCTVCGIEARVRIKKERAAKKYYDNMARLNYQVRGEYIDNRTPIKFVCDKGHEDEAPPCAIRDDSICKYCSGWLVHPDDVRKVFEAKKCKLLDPYKGNKKKMRYRCPEGHLWATTLSNFQRTDGYVCGICSGHTVTHRFVKQYLVQFGYKLEKTYDRRNGIIYFECPSGHHHSMNWSDFRSGQRCGLCDWKNFDAEAFYKAVEEIGVTLLGPYVNYNTRIPARCPEGHHFKALPEVLKRVTRSGRNTGCPKCNGRHKTPEEQAIRRMKTKIAYRVKDGLRRYAKNGGISASCYAAEIVEAVYRHLGEPPSKSHDLDHIVPQSFFNITIKRERDACWSIENLRWLPGNENSARGNRLTMEEVEQFTDKQLKILATASLRPSKFDDYLRDRGIKFKPVRKNEDAIQLPLFGIGA